MRASLPALLSLSLTVQPVMASCARDAMIVFDGSASMAEISLETGTTTRIKEAREAMAIAMPLIEDVRRIGLLTYGPGTDDACSGIELAVAPQDQAATPVLEALEALRPAGLTPLSAAVERAADVLDYRRTPGIVVLVTDGNETCGGTPCATSRRLADQARDLTIHVIGFRATRDFFLWDNPEQQEFGSDTVAKCFADRTGGLFLSTETVAEDRKSVV